MEEQFRHTPGPWDVEYTDRTTFPRAIKTDSGEHVTFVDGSRYTDDSMPDPEAQANARLIAAAPELLAALKALAEREDVLQYGARARGCWREYKNRLIQARAAIAKAETKETANGN